MEEEKKKQIEIDGSMLEGGGQIFRMSMALAYLVKNPLRITKIRAKRDKGGGLGNQHLAGIHALKQLTGCTVEGDKKKSTEVSIIPSLNAIALQKMTVDCKSVGSVHLILQILLPLLISAPDSIKLTIKGGTHVAYSPMSASAQFVLFPLLKRMGIKLEYFLKYFGLFPDMIGLIEIISNPPIDGIAPLEILEKGTVTTLTYYVVYTDNEIEFSQEFKAAVKQRTKAIDVKNKGMSEDMVKVGFKKKARCFTINAVCQTDTGCYFAVSKLVDSKELSNPEKHAQAFMDEVEQAINDPELCIDQHHADQVSFQLNQVLVYMAMANGLSKLKVKRPVTLHFKTMLSLLRIICSDIKIRIRSGESKESKEEEKEVEVSDLTKLTTQEDALLDGKEGSLVIEIEGVNLMKPIKHAD